MDERTALARRFCDRNSDVQILLISYRTTSVGLNLHSECHNIVFMEPAQNANT
ncbi:MAG: hypothetical protein M1833_000356, partial [Piccolia ochrophora]